MNTGQKLEVLVLSTNSDEGGAPRHVENLINLLASDVKFTIIFGEEGPVYRRLRATGRDVRILSGMRSSFAPLTDIVVLLRLMKIIKETKPVLIHCHSSKAGLLGRIAGRLARVPVLFTVHGWSWQSLTGLRKAPVFLTEILLARLGWTSYIYVSKAVERTGTRYLRLKESYGRIVYNGAADMGVAIPPSGTPISVMMPARVAYPKDHETLVRAFEMLNEEFRLVLCGEGTASIRFLNDLRRWAPTRHHQIVCLGAISDMKPVYNSTHIMVLSSLSEAMPLSIIEAMSAALPVVAADVGGVSEQVLHGQTGYLYSPKDVIALADSIRLLSDALKRKEMGCAARKRFEALFTPQEMASKTLRAYQETRSPL